MTLSLMVRVGYRAPRDREPKQTHLSIPYDDTAPLSGIPRAVSRAVEEWGREFGYAPFEWELKSAYLGRFDFFRGAVHPFREASPRAL